MKPVKNNIKLVTDNKQIELTEEEKTSLVQAATNVEAAEKAYKDNESVILQIQNLSIGLESARNAYAAQFYQLCAKHKLDPTTASPTQDRRGIQVVESGE